MKKLLTLSLTLLAFADAQATKSAGKAIRAAEAAVDKAKTKAKIAVDKANTKGAGKAIRAAKAAVDKAKTKGETAGNIIAATAANTSKAIRAAEALLKKAINLQEATKGKQKTTAQVPGARRPVGLHLNQKSKHSDAMMGSRELSK